MHFWELESKRVTTSAATNNSTLPSSGADVIHNSWPKMKLQVLGGGGYVRLSSGNHFVLVPLPLHVWWRLLQFSVGPVQSRYPVCPEVRVVWL